PPRSAGRRGTGSWSQGSPGGRMDGSHGIWHPSHRVGCRTSKVPATEVAVPQPLSAVKTIEWVVTPSSGSRMYIGPAICRVSEVAPHGRVPVDGPPLLPWWV